MAGLTVPVLVGQGGLGMGNRDIRSRSYYNFSKRGLLFIKLIYLHNQLNMCIRVLSKHIEFAFMSFQTLIISFLTN